MGGENETRTQTVTVITFMRGLILLGQVLTNTDVVNYIYIYLWLNDVISLMISKRESAVSRCVLMSPTKSGPPVESLGGDINNEALSL